MIHTAVPLVTSTLSKASLQSLVPEILRVIFLWLPLDSFLLEFCLASKSVYLSSPITSIQSANTFVKLRLIQSNYESMPIFLKNEGLSGDTWMTLPFPLQIAVFHQTLIGPTGLIGIKSYRMFTVSNKYLLAMVKAIIEELDYEPTNRLLRWACELEHVEIVDMCLRNPLLDISTYKNAAFYIAHTYRRTHIAKLLLNDPRYDKRDDQNHISYLNLLCIYGMYEELQSWILDPRINPSENNSKALIFAIENGHFEVVDVLLTDGRVNPNNRNVLKLATKKGRDDIVQRILEDPRTNPSLEDNVALLIAGHGNYKTILEKLLLDPRINVTLDNNILFINSCVRRYVPLIKALLLDGRADPTAQGNYALKYAIRHRHTDVIHTLLADSRIDPKFGNNAILSMSVPAYILKTFLQNPRMNLLAESARVLVELINKDRSDIVQLLLKDGQINPCAKNLAALVTAVSTQNKTISAMLLSDRRVISELCARREYYENVIGTIYAPRTFRADMVKVLIENRMSHLT
ncbi:hypothetical protein HDU79_011629, partial [Rhizoclosmatium sp. JEL0117]